MPKILLILILITISISQTVKIETFSIGEKISFKSTMLNEERQLNIYLPSFYDHTKEEKYDVIYLLDGSEDEDFIHIAGLVQFATFPWVKLLPNTIVVGIANVDRKRDFSFPTKDEKQLRDFPTSGGSKKFIDYIEKEVIPYVQDNYQVSEERTLIGQSFGGLLASQILLKKTDLFTKYIIVSPSLWWDNQSLLNEKPIFLNSDFDSKLSVIIAVGKEGEVMENDAKSLFKIVQKTNTKKIYSAFHFYEKQNHGNILHRAIYKAFETLTK